MDKSFMIAAIGMARFLEYSGVHIHEDAALLRLVTPHFWTDLLEAEHTAAQNDLDRIAVLLNTESLDDFTCMKDIIALMHRSGHAIHRPNFS